VKSKLEKCTYCKKKYYYKTECRKMKCDLEKKDKDESEKKPAKTLHKKMMSIFIYS